MANLRDHRDLTNKVYAETLVELGRILKVWLEIENNGITEGYLNLKGVIEVIGDFRLNFEQHQNLEISFLYLDSKKKEIIYPSRTVAKLAREEKDLKMIYEKGSLAWLLHRWKEIEFEV